MTAYRLLLSIAILAAAGSGCATFKVDTPKGFVKLDKTNHPYKAVSADGAVLAVRSWKNSPKAALAFWADVVNKELTEQRGYKLVQQQSTKTASGVPGRRFRYAAEHRGDRFVYQLSLFVSEDRIYAVEAALPAKDRKKHAGAIDAFVRSFRVE